MKEGENFKADFKKVLISFYTYEKVHFVLDDDREQSVSFPLTLQGINRNALYFSFLSWQ